MLGAAKLRAPRKKKTPAMLWKELRCGSKLWDPRISYQAIGKDADSGWDEVSQVSAFKACDIVLISGQGLYGFVT
jgi:hypothetical protein